MTTNELVSVLRQVPASLLFQKKGQRHCYASNVFFKRFYGDIDIHSGGRIQPRFLDPITKEELQGQSDPLYLIESGEQLHHWVKIESDSRTSDCYLQGEIVENGASDWLVVNVKAPESSSSPDSNQNAIATKHILFNQLLSTLSSKLIKATSDEIDLIVNQCLAAFGEFCNVDRCYLFKFIENETAMTNTHEWVSGGVTAYIDDLQAMPTESLPYFFSLLREGLFKVDDVAELPKEAYLEKAEFEREGIVSVLCVPIVINSRLYGFIGCDITGTVYRWKNHDVEYLTRIGEMLGNTIENLENRKAVLDMQSDLLIANKKLEKLANIDGLTGIANRRLFDNTLSQDIGRCGQEYEISLLLLDVDEFKLYNDTYGHVAGDKVLQKLAHLLKDTCKGSDDLVARYGGEEFAIILPKTANQTAVNLAQQIVKKVQDLAIEHSGSKHNKVLTVSIGVITELCERQLNASKLIENADKALYRAKSSGKNGVSP